MKIVKIASLILLLLLVIIFFPLNPYLAAFLAIISLGAAFLIRRK